MGALGLWQVDVVHREATAGGPCSFAGLKLHLEGLSGVQRNMVELPVISWGTWRNNGFLGTQGFTENFIMHNNGKIIHVCYSLVLKSKDNYCICDFITNSIRRLGVWLKRIDCYPDLSTLYLTHESASSYDVIHTVKLSYPDVELVRPTPTVVVEELKALDLAASSGGHPPGLQSGGVSHAASLGAEVHEEAMTYFFKI